jgi:hypothetical protein
MATLPKEIYRINTITIKIPTVFFAEMETFNLKLLWNFKGPKLPKTVLKRKMLQHSYFSISKLTAKLQ